MNQEKFLTDRTAVITGAGRGLGEAIAKELSRLGARVILVSRTQSRVEAVAADIGESGGSAKALAADIRDTDWLADVIAEEGCIDILVHAASAFAEYGPLEQRTNAEISAVLDTNLGAALRISAALLPAMRAQNYGMLLFIGSLAGSMGGINQVIYSTAKAGLSGLVKSLAVENAHTGINAHLLELGLFDTERVQEAMTDGAREHMIDRTPAGRIGNPEDVAAAVRYLLSPDAQFLRGVTLPVTGGMGLGVIPPRKKQQGKKQRGNRQ